MTAPVQWDGRVVHLDEITRTRLERGLAWVTQRCWTIAQRLKQGARLAPEELAPFHRLQKIVHDFPDLTDENAVSLATAIEQEITR